MCLRADKRRAARPSTLIFYIVTTITPHKMTPAQLWWKNTNGLAKTHQKESHYGSISVSYTLFRFSVVCSSFFVRQKKATKELCRSQALKSHLNDKQKFKGKKKIELHIRIGKALVDGSTHVRDNFYVHLHSSLVSLFVWSGRFRLGY